MKKISVLLLAFCLTACLGTTPASNFYQLAAPDNVAPVSQRRISIRIDEVSVPRYLDRPQIVTFEPNGTQLNIAEFDRWAESYSTGLSRILADDISAYLPKAVVKFQAISDENFTYTVETEINRFDAVLGQEIKLDAWWTVYKNGRMVIRERSRLQLPVGNGYQNLVVAESALIGQLARQIAEKIAKN